MRGSLLLLLFANAFLLLFQFGCRTAAREPTPEAGAPGTGIEVTAEAPSPRERYCAWYGSARDSVLYFGEAAFWSALRRSGGDPTADLLETGPQRIGRFDLAAETLLSPLDVGPPEARSGVWDVLAHPNGRIYFTTFYEQAGYADPESGAVVRWGPESVGLNELAVGPSAASPAPDARAPAAPPGVLASRYGRREGGQGSVVWLDPDGRALREHALEPPPGYLAAPKTVAWDPVRDEVWVTTDLLPQPPHDGELPERHDAFVLDGSGRERARVGGGPGEPEIQFVHFDPDGRGALAVADAERLELALLESGVGADGVARARRVLLDDAFVPELDFAQDVQPTGDGGFVVTRWSGWIHVVDASGGVRSLRMPAREDGGLYYTAVTRDGRVCATYCADVTVVCRDLPR